MSTTDSSKKFPSLGVGLRYSTYGAAPDPGMNYWAKAAREMAGRFPGSTPEMIWIVSNFKGKGTQLTFPGIPDDPLILFSGQDSNEAALSLFDQLGIHVWLQVEPGNARVEQLFDLVLSHYGHHSCIVGVGVDVEWHHSSFEPEGEPVGDQEAASWLAAAQAHHTGYRLFVKHWVPTMLPPTLRECLLFVDDSQGFASLEAMVDEFTRWGRIFDPAPVAFQFGYPADKSWWARLDDPPKAIGEAIRESVPNTAGLFWVDFSAREIFRR